MAVAKMIAGHGNLDGDELNARSSPLTSMADSDDDYERVRPADTLRPDTASDITSSEHFEEESKNQAVPPRKNTSRKHIERTHTSPPKTRPSTSKKRPRQQSSTSAQRTSVSAVLPRSSHSARADSRPSRPVVSSAMCHQCRRPNKWVKMTCANTMESGELCRKSYCAYCVLKRYPEITFDAFSKTWTCPWCEDACNCTICCTKRGEDYVSTRFEKIDEEALKLVTSGEAMRPNISAFTEPVRGSSKTRTSNSSKKPSADPLIKTAGLLEQDGGVRGEYWATVFSVEGDRIGKGFIGESASEIIVQLDDEPGGKKARRLVIGRWHRGTKECSDDEDEAPTRTKEKGKGRVADRRNRKRLSVGEKSTGSKFSAR